MRTLPEHKEPEHEEDGEIHITSQLVHVKAEHLDAVCQTIGEMEGAEVFERLEGGRIIVLAEGNSLGLVSDILDRVSCLPGVVSNVLVYHHCEAVSAMNEAINEALSGGHETLAATGGSQTRISGELE